MLDTRTYDIEVTELMSEIRYDLRGRFTSEATNMADVVQCAHSFQDS